MDGWMDGLVVVMPSTPQLLLLLLLLLLRLPPPALEHPLSAPPRPGAGAQQLITPFLTQRGTRLPSGHTREAEEAHAGCGRGLADEQGRRVVTRANGVDGMAERVKVVSGPGRGQTRKDVNRSLHCGPHERAEESDEWWGGRRDMGRVGSEARVRLMASFS